MGVECRGKKQSKELLGWGGELQWQAEFKQAESITKQVRFTSVGGILHLTVCNDCMLGTGCPGFWSSTVNVTNIQGSEQRSTEHL